MITEQPPLPVTKAGNPVVVRILRRTPYQQAVAHFVIKGMLRPTITILAERNLIPLFCLMVIARFCKLLPLPNCLHTLFEYVTHFRGKKAVQTAERDCSVIVHRQRIINRWARSSLFWRFHLSKCAILKQQSDTDAIDYAGPAIDERLLLM